MTTPSANSKDDMPINPDPLPINQKVVDARGGEKQFTHAIYDLKTAMEYIEVQSEKIARLNKQVECLVHNWQDADKVKRARTESLESQLQQANKRIEEQTKTYHELILSVQRVWPKETRHETALRYIRQVEAQEQMGSETNSIKPNV